LVNKSESELKCIVGVDDAEKLAKPYGRFGDDGKFDPDKNPQKDPFNDSKKTEYVPASLLSAKQIIAYVKKTGLIAPFYTGGGENSLLKDASYEGKIGSKAFIFKPGETVPEQAFSAKSNKVLKVPANSIVFVECDLDFRLPDFIALRFNLQIKHVHRGLLLGTGPLVDPGYWGKLCIPLHNLTDEDYEIPKDEGLIWIEFTKTSGADSSAGRPPLGKAFWDIERFLEKASESLVQGAAKKVGIRSSIPTIFKEAKENSDQALKKVKSARNWNIGGLFVGLIAAIATLVAVFSLAYNYNIDTRERFNELRPTIDKYRALMEKIDSASQSTPEAKKILSDLATNVQQNGRSIRGLVTDITTEQKAMKAILEKLLKQNAELSKRITRIEQKEPERTSGKQKN